VARSAAPIGRDFGGAYGANLRGEPQAHHVVGLGVAFDQVQNAARNQAAHGVACGLAGDANAMGQPRNRELELQLAFEAAVAKKMRVDGAVGQRKAELRREQVFHLFPHLYRIDFFVVHSFES